MGKDGSGRQGGVRKTTRPAAACTTPAPAGRWQGYVTHSNVSAVDEMVNMISASRSYQNNVEVMNTAKTLLLKTLQLGQ
jgi:flagellar basal-body rod protein FlgC